MWRRAMKILTCREIGISEGVDVNGEGCSRRSLRTSTSGRPRPSPSNDGKTQAWECPGPSWTRSCPWSPRTAARITMPSSTRSYLSSTARWESPSTSSKTGHPPPCRYWRVNSCRRDSRPGWSFPQDTVARQHASDVVNYTIHHRMELWFLITLIFDIGRFGLVIYVPGLKFYFCRPCILTELDLIDCESTI